MHRDLKPHNLLLFDNGQTLKICDFGISRFQTANMATRIGTPAYMAPETWTGSLYNEKVDVYSWGILCWEVLLREKPYDCLSITHLEVNVHQGKNGFVMLRHKQNVNVELLFN